MFKRSLSAALLSLVISFAAAAQTVYTISPSAGPVEGGTQVTITSSTPFGGGPYTLYFGTAAVSATLINSTTIRAITPPHLPGAVEVLLMTGARDIAFAINRTFAYEGDTDVAYERLLLPVYTQPIPGAFGSEFRTELNATLAAGDRVAIYGLSRNCTFICIQGPDDPHVLTTDFPRLNQNDVEPDGTPGQFVYIPRDQSGRVAMNLRAYDTSRSAENFGTEIPVVRDTEFADIHPIVLVGIPTDARFRNTLRIYSAGQGGNVSLRIQGAGVDIQQSLHLPAQPDLLHPGYVQFSNFPIGVGPVRVTIDGVAQPSSPPQPSVSHWAFVSVTNNATQHITTITPQPRRKQ
jgi:hypothetical protein